MLVDVEFENLVSKYREINRDSRPEHRMTEEEIQRIGGSPTRLRTGLYLGHLNFNHQCLTPCWRYADERYWSLPEEERITAIRKLWETERFPDYGVCDYPEQLLEKYPEIETNEARYWVKFTEIRHEDQPDWGGWRWHKWGPYIGKHEPQHEYLYNEEGIERVYVFHVYEVKNA